MRRLSRPIALTLSSKPLRLWAMAMLSVIVLSTCKRKEGIELPSRTPGEVVKTIEKWQKTQEKDSGAKVEVLEYDSLEQLVHLWVSDTLGEVQFEEWYTYDKEGRLSVKTRSDYAGDRDGQTRKDTYTYNEGGKPLRVDFVVSNGDIGYLLYEYDKKGNAWKQNTYLAGQLIGSEAHPLEYDSLDRLIWEGLYRISGTDTSKRSVVTYAYDNENTKPAMRQEIHSFNDHYKTESFDYDSLGMRIIEVEYDFTPGAFDNKLKAKVKKVHRYTPYGEPLSTLVVDGTSGEIIYEVYYTYDKQGYLKSTLLLRTGTKKKLIEEYKYSFYKGLKAKKWHTLMKNEISSIGYGD